MLGSAGIDSLSTLCITLFSILIEYCLYSNVMNNLRCICSLRRYLLVYSNMLIEVNTVPIDI